MISNKKWLPPFQRPDSEDLPIGYSFLVSRYQLEIVFQPVWTFVRSGNRIREHVRDHVEYRFWPKGRHPGTRDLDHLLFAIRHEGLNLSICRAFFAKVSHDEFEADLCKDLQDQPTSAYRRRVWFLWEAITERLLSLTELNRGNYVPLLDSGLYVVGPSRKVKRQRIDVNLLGSLEASPIIRLTPKIRAAVEPVSLSTKIRQRVEGFLEGYESHIIRRALSYLYTRETRASFEIENERPSQSREERFMALLERSSQISRLDRKTLVDLQNDTVDPRFADSGWRTSQIYVGEALDYTHQRIHYIGPKAEDVDLLMTSFLDLTRLLVEDPDSDALIAASTISFFFVLIHPFEDGNGRLHRWLINWVLARKGITQQGLLIPISAAIQSRRAAYDEALESFSRWLLQRIDYELDELGRMEIEGDTLDFYRHPDLTAMTEGLIDWLDVALREELEAELAFLFGLDRAKQGLQRIVDMPDRQIVLFIKLCRQNGGKLAKGKRQRFAKLTDEEVAQMEAVVSETFFSNLPT